MSTTPETAGIEAWQRGSERRDHDVRAIGGHEHERPVDELLDEVLDAHRPHPDVAHLAVQALRRLEEDLGLQGRGDLADRRSGQVGMLAST